MSPRSLVVAPLLFAACAGEAPSPARALTTPEAEASLFYADWDDPASFDQLVELENDPEAGDMAELIDALIAEALAGVPDGADAKTKLLHLVWHIHTRFTSGTPEPSYTTRRALVQRVAECGGSSLVLQLAARRLGYATRGVGLFGVPIQGGHTAVEVYWGDGWHYLDPSFGAFFTADGTIDGEVLDFDTVLRHKRLAADNAFYPVADGRLGPAYPSPKPATLAEMYGKEQIDQPESGDYALFLPHTVAASVYSPEAVLETRYAVDLSTGTAKLGARDGSIDDLALHRGADGVYDGSSLYFTGDLSSSHGVLYGVLTFALTNVEPGQTLTWQADLVSGDAAAIDVEVRKARLVELARDGKRVRVTLEALRDEAEVRLVASRKARILFDAHAFTAR